MEDVDEKLLAWCSAEYICEAIALTRVSLACEEADGGCVEEFAEAAAPAVRDERASGAAGTGEEP